MQGKQGKNSILTPEVWKFATIPKSELRACCVWEYAQEPTSICDAVVKANKVMSDNAVADAFPELVALNEGISEEAAYAIMLHLHRSGLFHLTVFSPTRIPFPKPWQSLNAEQRNRCVTHFIIWTAKWQEPFAIWDDLQVLRELSEQVRKHNTEMAAFMAKRMRGIRVPLSEVKSGLPSVITDRGLQHVLVRINWRDFTNDAIAEYFREWVKEHRPSTIQSPKKTGHREYSLVALRDLGVMRLMNFCTVAEMRARCPAAADYFGNLGWESKHWSAARNRAMRNFRAFFPFLPQGEVPLHAPTKGGRAKL
jgi:hypothetical protein